MKKVLRVIGGFFAKIGRWIANTAWVQPLLIVGGIFAVIFSIPYIKDAIDRAQPVPPDEAVLFYKNRAISLDGAYTEDGNTGTSNADVLFDKLMDFTVADQQWIKDNYGDKFFLTFATESCPNCKTSIDGYNTLSDNFATWGLNSSFRLYTIMMDTTDSDGHYLAKSLFEHHQPLLDDIVGEYAEYEDYPLLKNITDNQAESLRTSIEKLAKAIDDNGEGLDTPCTFMIDLSETKTTAEVSPPGVTAIFFNYTSLMKEELTPINKGTFLKYCWSYTDVFDKNYDKD